MAREVDANACCEPPVSLKRPDNAPGQSELRARLGSWADFYQVMRDQLPRYDLPDGDFAGERPLRALTTRDPADPTLALLDAAATVAHVLCFYTERITQEGYLRTATERRSVLRLADMIGYRPSPGLSASCWVAITVDETDTGPDRVSLPTGSPIGTIPGPGELPATFETAADLEARPSWNALRPPLTQAHELTRADDTIWLQTLSSGLRAGDAILIVGKERERHGELNRWEFRFVTGTDTDADRGLTAVHLERRLGWARGSKVIHPPREDVRYFRMGTRTAVWGHDAPDWTALPRTSRMVFDPGAAQARDSNGDFNANDDPVKVPWRKGAAKQWPGFALDASEIDGATGKTSPKELGADPRWIDLDGKFDALMTGGFVVLREGNYDELIGLDKVELGTRTSFTLTKPYTRCYLDGATEFKHLEGFDRRRTVAYADSQPLPRAGVPVTDDITGKEITVVGTDLELLEDKVLLAAGVDASTGERHAEPVVVLRTSEADGLTTITLLDGLSRTYQRIGFTLHANVVAVSHGESVREIVGHGDAGATFQRFAIKRAPLTHLPSAEASGASPALEVWVDGVRWTRVDTLFGRGPDERVYVVEIANDGTPGLLFGDGITGARLPTGLENVSAIYRHGLGEMGNVGVAAIALPKKRPLGLVTLSNPVPAVGGTEPDTLDHARAQAPTTMLTLDRVVSRSDVEQFARARPGIAKASAVTAWSGQRQVVLLTHAGTNGAVLDDTDPIVLKLIEAIVANKDPTLQVRVAAYDPVYVRLAAQLVLDPTRDRDDVLAAAETAVRQALSFSARQLGAALTASSVIATLQRVEGVVAVDLDALWRTRDGGPAIGDEDSSDNERAREAWLPELLDAASATVVDDEVSAAELLLIDPDPKAVTLFEVTR